MEIVEKQNGDFKLKVGWNSYMSLMFKKIWVGVSGRII